MRSAGGKMKECIGGIVAAIFFWGAAPFACAEQPCPTLTVSGHGEVSAAPDEAAVRLGAVAQAEKATVAQEQVNAAVQALLKGIKGLGIPEEKIATVELSLTPVYGNRPRSAAGKETEPVIIGYRASNTVRVRVDDLKILGKVVDAGLAAGGNRVEAVSFGLKDDREQRRQALSLAAGDARSKAESIARAMGVQIIGVRSISEGGMDIVRPQMDSAPRLAAMAAPIQPGQIQVKATLAVTYEISEPKGPPWETGALPADPKRR
jgi:uncharacterized protein YggE